MLLAIKPKLHILYSAQIDRELSPNTQIINFGEVVQLIKGNEFIKHIGKYSTVFFHCSAFQSFPRQFFIAVICRLLASENCVWVDRHGRTKKIWIGSLLHMFCDYALETLYYYRRWLKFADREISELSNKKYYRKNYTNGIPVYLMCELSYDYAAGGSLGHIAGVANNLGNSVDKNIIFISTNNIPLLDEHIEYHIFDDSIPYKNNIDVARLALNDVFFHFIEKKIAGREICFIYQRSALNAYAGLKYALLKNIPFVLEYNGSEVWVTKKWGGRSLKTGNISEKIEQFTFEKADLITCVSKPLKEQLVELGIDKNKIIVNPNGVNTELYSPDIDGNEVRRLVGIDEKSIVIGFIGTFGVWHGAEILTEAFASIMEDGYYKEKVRLLLVGDGATMPKVKYIIKKNNIEDKCILTGIVPQKYGAKYLAACDILVSPTIKNPDGTPFFGSPTKLFEYMAMGKAIITSNMDQMAEILKDKKTALLCEPGNKLGLVTALKTLINDKHLRIELGRNARIEVCKKYTWKMHTEKIVRALENVLRDGVAE